MAPSPAFSTWGRPTRLVSLLCSLLWHFLPSFVRTARPIFNTAQLISVAWKARRTSVSKMKRSFARVNCENGKMKPLRKMKRWQNGKTHGDTSSRDVNVLGCNYSYLQLSRSRIWRDVMTSTFVWRGYPPHFTERTKWGRKQPHSLLLPVRSESASPISCPSFREGRVPTYSQASLTRLGTEFLDKSLEFSRTGRTWGKWIYNPGKWTRSKFREEYVT